MEYLRDGIPDKYGILKLQEKILQIAVYIDKICQENNIDYYLMGGSALGAVRHGGFIPWDDDLDIFMTPDNYQRFKSVFMLQGDKEQFYLQELSLNDKGMIASAKLRLNGTTLIETGVKSWNIHHGIFVDIFLIHNCPKLFIPQLFQCFAAKYILIRGQSIKNVKYSGGRAFALQLFSVLPKNAFIKSSFQKLYKYNKKKTPFVCDFMSKSFFKDGIYDASYFREPVRVPFEKVMLNIPTKTHEYLTERFGNYMKLPPESSIHEAQHAEFWDTERDFSYYLNKKRDFSDELKLV